MFKVAKYGEVDHSLGWTARLWNTLLEQDTQFFHKHLRDQQRQKLAT